MVHISLDSRYALSSDVHQWIILQDGRPKWFYPTLYDLLNDWLLNEKPKLSEATTVSGLLEYLKQQQERLYTLLTSFDFRGKLPILVSGNKEEKQ